MRAILLLAAANQNKDFHVEKVLGESLYRFTSEALQLTRESVIKKACTNHMSTFS